MGTELASLLAAEGSRVGYGVGKVGEGVGGGVVGAGVGERVGECVVGECVGERVGDCVVGTGVPTQKRAQRWTARPADANTL